MVNNLSNQSGLLKKLFESKIADIDRNGKISTSLETKKVLDAFIAEFSKNYDAVDYSCIADYVFTTEAENSSEDNENLEYNINLLLDKAPEENRALLNKNLIKIRNHYNLSRIQKRFVRQNAEKANNLAQELYEKTLPEIQKQIKNTEDTIKNTKYAIKNTKDAIEEVEATKSSIYTDMIAILGVFSAFVFLMFGGIEVIRAVFDVADDLGKIQLTKLVSIGSLMMIAVLTMLYSLLLWIARITGKEFGSCLSSKCKDGCKHKWRHCILRHSFYFGMMILLVLLTILTSVCKF